MKYYLPSKISLVHAPRNIVFAPLFSGVKFTPFEDVFSYLYVCAV